jgi:hydrogenase-4 component B
MSLGPAEAPLSVVLAAILVTGGSGFAALLFPRGSRRGQRLSAAIMAAGCAAGLAGALFGLFAPPSASAFLPWSAVGGALVGMDPLSAFFLAPVFLVGGLASVYALGYWPQPQRRRTGLRLGVFFGLLAAGMALLVIARHALSFILGWEVMALSAFFLVSLEDESRESRRAGFIYLISTHVGTLALFAFFALWRWATGSFSLQGGAAPGVGAAAGLFALALLGFGLKAGAMPLHFWLPGAHAAAPSQVSAMLSGVVLKMGIYGLLRVLSLIPALPASWGWILLVLGAASSLLGVAFAIAQHDIKRLLAYHSVENIGIILMGMGLAVLGVASGRRELFVLGMAGCLLHVWNHSLFKALLFLGAGSVVKATGTRTIDRLGGLAKAMPWTAAFFIAGAVAICGLPPLNGFVSELLVYLGLFSSMAPGSPAAAAAIAAPLLAMTGALALACFVKVSGVAFLGSPRGPQALRAKESPASMLAPMAVLAALCALIGLAPFLLAPALDSVVASWAAAGAGARLGSGSLPGIAEAAPLGTIGAASGALALLVGLAALALVRSGRRAAKAPTWDCGYAKPTARMQYGASSFARSIVGIFAWALRPPKEGGRIEGFFPKPGEKGEAEAPSLPDFALDRALAPAMRALERLSIRVQRLQTGLAQSYVLYILIALALLALTLIPFGDIFARLAAS